MGFTMQDDTWDVLFQKETDRRRRREILKRAQEAGLLSAGEAELRSRVLDARYDQIKDQPVDYFIRGFTRLSSLRGKETKGRMRRMEEKIMQQVLEDWQYDVIQKSGTAGRTVWYGELYNMTRLYIELCETDKRYNSVLLGFGKIKDDTRVEKIAAELSEMLYVLPERFGKTEELSVFVRAAEDAFADRYPDDAGMLRGTLG